MDIQKGDIVISQAGRDKGRLFFVIDVIDQQFAVLADGKLRKLDKPKKKKLKHIKFVSKELCKVRDKILNGEKIENAELRKALRLFENPLS